MMIYHQILKGSSPFFIQIKHDKPKSGWPKKPIIHWHPAKNTPDLLDESTRPPIHRKRSQWKLTTQKASLFFRTQLSRNFTISHIMKTYDQHSSELLHISSHVFHVLILLTSNNASITDRTHRSHLHMHAHIPFISIRTRHCVQTNHLSIFPAYFFLKKYHIPLTHLAYVTCYIDILWMVAESCTTLYGWNPINHGMFSTVFNWWFRWPIHRITCWVAGRLAGGCWGWTNWRKRLQYLVLWCLQLSYYI